MNLSNSQKEKIKLLVSQAISKVGDRPEVLEELEDIVSKCSESDEYSLELTISKEDILYIYEVLGRLEELIKTYVENVEVNDIDSLENIKKHVSVNLMYISSFKDKLVYEVEYLEDVFKKEIFTKIAEEISGTQGISFTQAEKKVNGDERYCDLRKQLYTLKTTMNFVKTKYDFFSKMVQVIVQSISVAGKEHYSSRVNNN